MTAPRTARRHRHYSNEEREVLGLAGDLRRLAEQYPRFSRALNKLKFRVELQLAKPVEKKRRILSALAQTRLLTVGELTMDTSLDEINVRETLQRMELAGEVEACARDGSSLGGGKGAGKNWRSQAYYRLARPSPRPARAPAAVSSLLAGPSQRSSRRG